MCKEKTLRVSPKHTKHGFGVNNFVTREKNLIRLNQKKQKKSIIIFFFYSVGMEVHTIL